ncbi:MAG: glycosyltransferase [Paracoccaceae bacterium]|nr:glycosyltransferase [Paracoccaceae bacterium]
MDPLRHYLCYGWAEGRDPAPDFDEARYRWQAGLSQRDRISGLGHYLVKGRACGFGPQNHAVRRADDDAAAVEAALARLARIDPPAAVEPAVDVIVPVYAGRAETLRCLASVLEAANRTGHALVVVDDHGPDPKLRADLRMLAGRGLIELLVPKRNLGFVGAVNLALRRQQGAGRDVIWLNADTEVFGDWIDRLRRVAFSAPDVATVTPLTNNGTICSYPRFDTDNCEALELDWAALDRLAAEVNRGQTVGLPTCVGFAVYVRRAAIEALGLLDDRAFGRGYGEENDFSQRAIRAGWRNLAAGEVFVCHIGQCSFGAERARRVAKAMQVLARRYPSYPRDVAAFVAADPMARLRRALDLARLKRLAAGRRRVLIVTHSLGGGTEQHVDEEIARLTQGGAGIVLMRGGAGGTGTVRLDHPEAGALPSLESVSVGGAELISLLGTLGITEIRLHHLADFGRDAARRMAWLIDAVDLPFEVTVHDYLAVCPRINLVDNAGMYCGEPGPPGAERACQRCLIRRRSRFGAPDITRWRQAHGRLLSMARIVKAPDRDVAERLRRYFPDLTALVVRPHDRRPAMTCDPARQRRSGPLRVTAIGAIGPIKGFDVLLGLAREAAPDGLHLTVIGHTRNDRAASAAGISVTGRYRNDDLPRLIDAASPDLILIPSIWPETYCYALSHALASGRMVAGFDIGAIGTRLHDAAQAGYPSFVLPLAMSRDPAALCQALHDIVRLEDLRENGSGTESSLVHSA